MKACKVSNYQTDSWIILIRIITTWKEVAVKQLRRRAVMVMVNSSTCVLALKAATQHAAPVLSKTLV